MLLDANPGTCYDKSSKSRGSGLEDQNGDLRTCGDKSGILRGEARLVGLVATGPTIHFEDQDVDLRTCGNKSGNLRGKTRAGLVDLLILRKGKKFFDIFYF